MKALVGAFNQEKALVGAFSVIVKSSGTFGKPSLEALQLTPCRWYSLYLRTSSMCWLGGSQVTRMEKAEVGRAVRLLGGPGSSTSCCVRTNTSGDEEPGP